MPFVIRPELVARSLQRLRAQKTHTLFPGYLHLQQRSAEMKRLTDLQPDFVAFYKQFLRVGEHPLGTPYLKIFTEQKPSDANLWLNPNVAGSYAPSSLRPNQPFRRVVEIDANRVYSLPDDHAARALEALLFEKPVSAVDLALVLYRDFGFDNGDLDIFALVQVFAYEFGYSASESADFNQDFSALYHLQAAENGEAWLQPFESEALTMFPVGEALQSDARTLSKVRELTADDLLSANQGKAPAEFQSPLPTIVVENLLSFGERTVFELERLNLLVGPNGSGKSNLIDCIRLLSLAPYGIQQGFTGGGFEQWLYKGTGKKSDEARLSAQIQLADEESIFHQLSFTLASTSQASIAELIQPFKSYDIATDFFFLASAAFPAELATRSASGKRQVRRMKAGEYNSFESILGQIRDVSQYPEITKLATLYSQFKLYTEWTFGRNSPLRDSAPTNRSSTSLSETMDNLALALNGLQNTEAHEKIRALLRELKESYADYNTQILFGRVALQLIEEPFDNPVPAQRLSDGTLRFLALATILLQPTPPPLICLEEPELGMHPDMIRMVADMIIQAKSKTQLIITTHSEMLLTALQDDMDALFVFNAGKDGSFVRRYSEQQFEIWRQEHDLGELWTAGELGGNRW